MAVARYNHYKKYSRMLHLREYEVFIAAGDDDVYSLCTSVFSVLGTYICCV
jgi:hypothetical protein